MKDLLKLQENSFINFLSLGTVRFSVGSPVRQIVDRFCCIK